MKRSNKAGLRSVILFVTLALVTLLAAVPSLAAEKVTLTWWSTPFWAVNGDVYGWQKAAISEFEKTHPNINVELTQLDWSNATTKLDTAIMARAYPDIATGATKVSTWAQLGILQPVDSYLTAEDQADIYPVALQKFTYKGHVYGLPWYTTTYVIYMNLDIFKERGVQPPADGNWTWDEFVEAARKLTYKDSNGQQVYGFASVLQPWYYQSFGILLSDGGKLLSDDGKKLAFSSPQGISGLQKLVDLVQKYKVSPLSMGSDQDNDLTKMFTDGHLAMLAQGTFFIRQLEKAQETTTGPKGFPFAVANYPSGKLGKPVSFHEGVGGFVIFKQKTKARADAAVEFVKFLTSKENQLQLSSYGTFPSRRSAGDIYKDDKYLSWVLRNAIPTLQIPPVSTNWLEVNKAIVPFFQLAILGKEPVEKAMSDAEKAANPILQR